MLSSVLLITSFCFLLSTIFLPPRSDEFDEDEQVKCSKCCCACCAPCCTRFCLPFRRCFRSCSGCCGRSRLGKRKADGQLAKEQTAKQTTANEPGKQSCWERLFGCCRRCRNSKTAPESTAIVQRAPAAASQPKSSLASCWQSLSCCASCRRNKSRELVVSYGETEESLAAFSNSTYHQHFSPVPRSIVIHRPKISLDADRAGVACSVAADRSRPPTARVRRSSATRWRNRSRWRRSSAASASSASVRR